MNHDPSQPIDERGTSLEGVETISAFSRMLVCMSVVLVVALTTRIAWTGYRWWTTPPDAPLPFADERDYWVGAVSLAAGDGPVDVDGRRATRMPLYPAMLSLVAPLTNGVWWVRLAQAVLGALAAPLVSALAWRLAGRRCAWVAGLLVAFDPFSVYFSQLLLTETLFTTALVAFWVVSWPLAMPDGRRRSWRWPVAGVLFLAMVYLHPSAIGLLPVWVLFLAIAARREGGNFAGVTLIVMVLLGGLAPWVWRNHRVLGQPVLLTTRLGISLYDGQGPQADGSSNLASARTMEADRLGECEWNRWFRDAALKTMWNDPSRVMRLAWVKLRRTWDPFLHASEAQSPGIQVIGAAWSLTIFALLIPGVWHLVRRPGSLLLLLVPALYFSALHAIFVGSIRYRLPVMPLIELLSAVGVCWLAGIVRPRWRPKLPNVAPMPTDYRPPTWLERQVSSRRVGRRPISIWRRRLATAGLLVLAMGYYAYRYSTSDERMRQQAVKFLTRFTGGQVRIGQAKFDLFSGISLRDVMIATPPELVFDPTARTFEDRLALAARTLQLRYEPLSVLTGRLRVTEILADKPTIRLVKNVKYSPAKPYNWQALFPPQPERPKRGRAYLPLIRVRNANVHILEILNEERHGEPPIGISALALPGQRNLDQYTVAWRMGGKHPERGKLFYALTDGAYTGELPAVSMKTVKAALPERYRDWLATLEIGGQIKPEHIRYDPQKGSQATVRLDGVRLSIPLDTQERPTTQAAGRFLQLSDVKGQLVLTPDRSEAQITGKLNDAPCTLKAGVTNYAGPLEEAGFDLHFVTTNIRLPDPNDPAGARFIQRIEKIRSFFNDFDPSGNVDVDFHMTKAAGSKDYGVLLRGTMTARGCIASYRMFPYRLTDVTGTVRFTDDGIYLDGLAGNHGSGFVVINGHLDDATWYTGLRLVISGDGVPLDPELYMAVPERFRRIWRRFEPVGLANANVRLRREPGTRESGPGKWTTHIEAELTETFARFVDFPYRLRHASGRLTIDNDRIEIADLRGAHGPASVALKGVASYAEKADRELELRLEARGLSLDADLADALPPDARETFDEIRPSGRVNLIGRVFFPPGAGDVSYTVAAHPHDAAICYKTLPVPVTGISGALTLTPQKIDVEGIAGRRGPTNVTVQGTIDRSSKETVTDLSIVCERLQLDSALYQALPDSIKHTWDTLAPSGEIHLTTRIRRAGSGPRLVSTHDTSVEALGNSMRYRGLPLPISDVRGQMRITDDSAELREIVGRHGPGRIALSGRIPLVGPQRTGRLRLQVEGMPFDKPLRDALPRRIRETWDAVKPAGTFDVDLNPLTYRAEPNTPTEWTYRGRMTVHDAKLDVGFQATQLEGSLNGKGMLRGDGSGIAVDAELDLDRVAINQRVLTDVTGQMRRLPGSDVLLLSDLIGRAYGGQASGFGRVTFGQKETAYALHVVVRDMALGPFLNATRPKNSPPTKAKGSVNGRLYLGGVSGQIASRQGTGEVHIRRAQMYKLPFVLAMLSTINFTIPDDNAFHDAQATFYIKGNELVFENIELQGKALSMLGSGSMDTETEALNLTFITGSPHPLPRVPLLIDLVRGVSRELMEIEITGPLGDPKMQGRPLRTLRTTLEAIFAPH